MNEKLLSFLGIARKAGKLSVGYEAVIGAIKGRESQLVLVASDISESTKDNLQFVCKRHRVAISRLEEDSFDITQAVGQNAGTISVNDWGIARKVKELGGICL